MIKETKTVKIEIRLTPNEKKLIKEYAEAHDITVSELIRNLCLSKITN